MLGKKINDPPKAQDDPVGQVSNLPENQYGRLETCPTTRPPVTILGFWRVVEKNNNRDIRSISLAERVETGWKKKEPGTLCDRACRASCH